jgi:hypothetical protein
MQSAQTVSAKDEILMIKAPEMKILLKNAAGLTRAGGQYTDGEA